MAMHKARGTIGNCMCTIIHSVKTGQYVGAEGWTADRKLARDFEGIGVALLYRSKLRHKDNFQIICQPRDHPSKYDITW